MTIQTGAVVGSVRTLLRLEGAVVTLVAMVLFARADASWWLFAASFLLPDLGLHREGGLEDLAGFVEVALATERHHHRPGRGDEPARAAAAHAR